MPVPIQILIVEDNPADAEMLVRELRRANFEPAWRRVETEPDFLDGLNPDLDLILSDYDMPAFNGLRALEILKKQGHDIPFILISGTVGEEISVEAIKMGATDYLMKDRIARLATAVNRALKESEIRSIHKHSEVQLRSKTAMLEALVYSSLDGILVVDNERKKVFQNQQMTHLWRIPQEFADDIDDTNQLQFVIAQTKYPRQFAEKVAFLYAQPYEISHDEIELVDGRILDRYSAPIRGKDGKYYGRIWTFRDITERKQAVEKIAEQAALLDKAQDAIIFRNFDGEILFWSKGAERIYGWTSEEAIGRKIGDLIQPTKGKVEEINNLVIENGEWSGELSHLAKDRRPLTVEVRCSLVRDRDGNPKSVLAINTDVTEKKKIEAQFIRAQRMESIGTLAGGIAHDLNNILAPIMMSIQLLESMTDHPQMKNMLRTIDASAKRGSDIVRQVLSFARGFEGQRIEIQSRQLLKDLENILHDTFPKDIRLNFFVSDNAWMILGDPTQVHQILLNLTVNARDAMPQGGDLTIGIENCILDEQYATMNIQAKMGRYVVISVIDSGTGISQNIIDKIFDPFFTTKDIGKGTGLGLSTAMAIVKSHDGFVNVYSEISKGTTFKVYLPAGDIPSETRHPAPELNTLPRGQGELILIVDDETSILTITGQTLQAYGYRVMQASDGAEAVAMYAQHRSEIAVVLTDMAMPIMDGPASIHALLRINPNVKIIAASGLSANGSLAKVVGTSIKHFLSKPYTAGTLLKTVRAILDETEPAPP